MSGLAKQMAKLKDKLLDEIFNKEYKKMGYRSDVAYMIKFHKAEDYWGFIAESTADPDTSYCWAKEEAESFKQNDKELSVQFYADQVKWYDGYEDVECHTNLWWKANERADNHKGMCDGYFVRIGEEPTDVEERQFGEEPPFDYINIHQSIETFWGNK